MPEPTVALCGGALYESRPLHPVRDLRDRTGRHAKLIADRGHRLRSILQVRADAQLSKRHVREHASVAERKQAAKYRWHKMLQPRRLFRNVVAIAGLGTRHISVLYPHCVDSDPCAGASPAMPVD
jgi:hypothetical protein